MIPMMCCGRIRTSNRLDRSAERFHSRWHCAAAALCALLFLSGSSRPAPGADANPLNAILIIARDNLPDSNFADSIVLVMNNLALGPVGIIVNRPMQIPVSRLFPDIERLAQVSDKAYFGGPVDFGSVWFLIRAVTPPEHSIKACDGVYLSADRQLLLRLLGRNKPTDGLRIFLGHAGWAPGQLEAEIERRDWTSKRADMEAIFSGKSEHPWPSPRKPERHLATASASPSPIPMRRVDTTEARKPH
jgi:putative transcriptional regulator